MRFRLGRLLLHYRKIAEYRLKRLRELVLDRPFRPGIVVKGRYTVRSVLGIGSFGISYLCDDAANGQMCVMKQVKPSKRAGRSGSPVFEREAATLRKLDHPGIPKLLDRFEERRQLFLCMEHKEGRNLEDIVFADGVVFSVRDALLIIKKAIVILEYVHGERIVHRDVRIPNLIWQPDGNVALIDFGLACPVSEDGRIPPEEDDAHEHYAEEKRIRREPVFASDFYALGHCLLFLLYTGYADQPGQSELGWEDELHLHPDVRRMIRKLLQTDRPYESIATLRGELDELIATVH
ncbi:serine/threonine-protein kinase [Paenibacillus hemerocallicola]|uniref:Serine/threonine-protein kinase n=1 Tax=Paenibacillus hemerocallicola TaxID=1172614 RepID=A0A5C4SV95_9BACL|nr:protein kinase [Paenibacillus hemerocallicola]TNJ53903.1 serine/threonine-protein kinase [Paenibacillus hemerocallicola]